jgi:hypothetical protein
MSSSSSVPPPADQESEDSLPSSEGRLGKVTTKSIPSAEVERAAAAREQRLNRKTPDPRAEGDPAAPVERVRLSGEFAEERTGTRTKTTPPGEER